MPGPNGERCKDCYYFGSYTPEGCVKSYHVDRCFKMPIDVKKHPDSWCGEFRHHPDNVVDQEVERSLEM